MRKIDTLTTLLDPKGVSVWPHRSQCAIQCHCVCVCVCVPRPLRLVLLCVRVCMFVWGYTCTHLSPCILLVLAPRPVLCFLWFCLCLAHLGNSRTDLADDDSSLSHPTIDSKSPMQFNLWLCNVRFEMHVLSQRQLPLSIYLEHKVRLLSRMPLSKVHTLSNSMISKQNAVNF